VLRQDSFLDRLDLQGHVTRVDPAVREAAAHEPEALLGGALLKDGSVKPADLVVLATGFDTQEVLVGKLLGDEVAKKVGRIWGLGPDGEMNNMWKRTAQEGLWFVGGSFTNCRIYSRYVALQIKAIEEGLLQWQ